MFNARDPHAKERANQLSNQIIGAAIEVHRVLGPGLLESAYAACLRHELALRGVPFEYELPLPIVYKELKVDTAYRLDLKVDGLVIVDLKAVQRLEPIHDAQFCSLTFVLQLSGWAC